MKMHSAVLSSILAAVIIFSFTGFALAKEKATREECVTKVKEAVKLIQKIGTEAAFKRIMDKSGPFIWKDSYVFCLDDKDAKIMAHAFPRVIGMPLKSWKDADGKQPFTEVLEVSGTKGEGWKSYMHRKPGARKPLLKTIYFIKEPASKTIVGAGYYKYE